jgi:hypothetical protein
MTGGGGRVVGGRGFRRPARPGIIRGMSDFTAEDLFDTADRIIAEVLSLHGVTEPPVDAVVLAQEAFDLRVCMAEPDEDEMEAGRFGPRPKRFRSRREIVLRPEMSEEVRNAACARGCVRELIPPILTKLGVSPGTENRSAQNQLIGLLAPRLLLPTRWFEKDARKAGYDLLAVKGRYPTAGYELVAMRFLDFDDPCVVAVVDDGTVSARRGNRTPATKKLTDAEQRCLDRIGEHGEPQTVRADGWTAAGWPIPTGPFNRIILRAVPDEI